MKTLLILNGLVFNNTKHVVDSIKKNLETKGFSVDVLISTWESEAEKCEYAKTFLHKNIDENYLDEISFPHTKQIANVKEWQYCRLSHYAIFQNLHDCLKNIDCSEYDFIVKSRTDLYFDFDKKELELDKNILYTFPVFWGGQRNNPNFMNDHVIMGFTQDILDYYDGVKNIKNELGGVWNSEMYSLRLVEKSNKKIKILNPIIYYVSKGWGKLSYIYKNT
jgi:hypothetical protein